jgi:hypothetical protein
MKTPKVGPRATDPLPYFVKHGLQGLQQLGGILKAEKEKGQGKS